MADTFRFESEPLERPSHATGDRYLDSEFGLSGCGLPRAHILPIAFRYCWWHRWDGRGGILGHTEERSGTHSSPDPGCYYITAVLLSVVRAFSCHESFPRYDYPS